MWVTACLLLKLLEALSVQILTRLSFGLIYVTCSVKTVSFNKTKPHQCVCVCVCVCVLTSSVLAESLSQCWPGSSVGIATDYGLDSPGIESRWGRDFTPVQTGPGAHPASCTMGTQSFPGVKCGLGVLLTTTPFQCRGHGRVQLYLYPPSGPHRACNRITLPLP